MNRTTRTTLWIMIGGTICVSLFFHGCGPKIRPLKNGYGISTEPSGIDRAANARYWYTTSSGENILIWPAVSFGFAGMRISGNLAVFEGYFRGADGMYSIGTFAVRAPGPAVKMKKNVLRLRAARTGLDIAAFNNGVDAGFEVHGDYVEFQFIFGPGNKDFQVDVSWKEVGEMVDECKKTGQLKNSDGVSYYE